MGQMATGLLYDCEAPDLPATDDDEPLNDLVDRWEESEGIEPTQVGPRVRIEDEGDLTLLGVWVAVGGSGEDGAPYFIEACVPLDGVEKAFKVRIAEAKRLWKRFAAYAAKTEKVKLAVPALWLTPCETA